jgi:hypothetical protein
MEEKRLRLALERIENSEIVIKNIKDDEFKQKYGFECPIGVRGRNSDNRLYNNFFHL